MNNDNIKKCPYCNRVFFDLGKFVCPFCGKELDDSIDLFKNLFGKDNPFNDLMRDKK